MFSRLLGVTFQAMLVHATLPLVFTGIMLPPTIRADALTDLGDLKTIINSAASQIGAPTNSSRNWGLWPPSAGSDLGTADTVTNITTSILRANYNLGSDQAKWLSITSTPNGTTNGTTPAMGTTPAGPTPLVALTDLNDPYIEYVMAVPNLSSALVALGRSWHRELNRPVYEAIDALQKSITEFSTSLLQADLIGSNATLRTIRGSSTLENAQLAWSRILNLPGPSSSSPGPGPVPNSAPSPSSSPSSSPSPPARARPETPGRYALRGRDDTSEATTLVEITFEEAQAELRPAVKRALPPKGKTHSHYTHSELWDRKSDTQQEEPVKAIPFKG